MLKPTILSSKDIALSFDYSTSANIFPALIPQLKLSA